MSHPSNHLQRPAVVLCALVALVGAGCLVSGGSSSRRTGNYVPDTTFAQIKEGQTTIAWVEATLGQPTTKATADDRVVYKYTYTEYKDSHGTVFLIFDNNNSTVTDHNAYVEFKDGVVAKKWRA